MFGNHVLHANQSCVLFVRVVDETLTEVFADMGAVVIRFDEASYPLARIVGIDVQGVEELADVVKRFEFLQSENEMVR